MWKAILNCFALVFGGELSQEKASSLSLERDDMTVQLFIVNPIYHFVNILNEFL